MKKVSEVSELSKEVPFTDVLFSPHGVRRGRGHTGAEIRSQLCFGSEYVMNLRIT